MAAGKVTIRALLRIRKDEVDYVSPGGGQFTEVLAGYQGRGPSPGMLIVPTTGRDVYFTELTQPGWCYIQNLDSTNYVQVGIYDPQTGVYYPLLEFPPGIGYPVKLTRNLQEQYAGSGTGTTGPENYLRIKANRASCRVIVDAFENSET